MKTVYDLATDLKADPQHVELAQALTLNSAKPEMGLKGKHGLFGSDTWWTNLRMGKIPTLEISGKIERAYCAGQGDTGAANTIDLRTDDGSLEMVGIYLNDERDVGLFQLGRRARILYALDELKKQPGPNGDINYSRIAVEMAVATD